MKKVIPFLLLITMISMLAAVCYSITIFPSWWIPIVIILEVCFMRCLSKICLQISTKYHYKILQWHTPIEIILFWIIFYFCMLPARDLTKPIYDFLVTIGSIAVGSWAVYGYRRLRLYSSWFPMYITYHIPKIW